MRTRGGTNAVSAEQRDEQRRRQVEEAHQRLADGVARLVNGREWRAMLAATARFHDYSWRNVLLILAQRPDATRVAGYRTWQALGRQVRTGEHGIGVLAPITYRPSPDTTDRMEEGQDQHSQPGPLAPRVRGWKIEHVFDIGQTDGQPLPDVPPALLDGDGPDGLWDRFAAQVTAAGFTLHRRPPSAPGALGEMNRTTRTVVVGDQLSGAQACKTLTHELAHVLLGHGTDTCTQPRSRQEVEAKSVAYVVLTAAGLDTSGYSFPYIAGWAGPGNETEVLTQTADRVITTARALLAAFPNDSTM